MLAACSSGMVATAGPATSVTPVSSGDPSSPYFIEVVPRPAAQRVDVMVGGRPFTSYIYPSSLGQPVLFPIRAANGALVTRGFPLEPRPGDLEDHPQQAGLWFGYGNVNGTDFSTGGMRDASRMGRIRQRSVDAVANGTGRGTLDVTTEWVDANGKTLLRENVHYVFRAQENLRSIDRITTLTALGEPLRFASDTMGLIGFRGTRELGKVASSETSQGSVWGTRGRWASVAGIVGDTLRVVLFDHPKNPGFPSYWYARGDGLLVADPLGRMTPSAASPTDDFRLAPSQSTTFRHQLLVMTGAPATQNLEPYYEGFTR